MATKRFGIVLGYGVPENIAQDENYRAYLTSVLVVCRDARPAPIKHLKLCGGRTNDNFPDKSEAGEMQKLLTQMGGFMFICTLSDHSITSWDNIAAAIAEHLEEREADDFRDAIVFCEKSRAPKIKLICRKLFPRHVKWTVCGIDFDKSRTFRKDLTQYADFILTFIQCFLPGIHRWRLARQRRHIARVSEK